MKYEINAMSIYEFGQRKDKDGNPHQEDWLYPQLGAIDNTSDRMFILCDGMGGHASGEVASSTVCEAMSNYVNNAIKSGDDFSETILKGAIASAYDLLDSRDNCDSNEKKMGTTMTFLMLHNAGYTIAHIGDSRVYHIRPNNGSVDDIVFKTEDHSLVNDLLKVGEITPEEAENFPRKNVITRAMQPHLEHRHRADIHYSNDILAGDYFFMCSDGMLEQTSDANLCFILNENISDKEKINMLINVSENNKDNHSAHLIHILKVSNEQINVAEDHPKQQEKGITLHKNNDFNVKRQSSKRPSNNPNNLTTILLLCVILLFGAFYVVRYMNKKSTESDEVKEEIVNNKKTEKRTLPYKQKIISERKTIEKDSVKQNTKTDVVKKDTVKQSIQTDTCQKKQNK